MALNKLFSSLFWIVCFVGIIIMILIGIMLGSFDYLSSVPFNFTFGLFDVFDSYINYFVLLGISVVVFAAVIFSGTQFLSSGLSDAALRGMQKIVTAFFIYFIATTFMYNSFILNIEIPIIRSFCIIFYFLIPIIYSANSLGGAENG